MKLIFSVLLVIATIIYQVESASVQHNIGASNTSPRRVEVEIEGETFLFGLDEYITWFEAEKVCSDLDMQLLTLESEDRWDMIKNFIYGNAVYDYWWWTSGRKPENTLEWSWSTTGTPFSYTVWYPNEPSNNELTDDSCMQLNAGNEFSPSGWDDSRCLDAFAPYICEKK